MPLHIVVCLKQIPNPDLQFQIAPDGKDIKRDALNYKLNGADEYALEEAVRLKEKSGGRVVALTAGPKRTEQMLREALAKGADEVIRIAFDEAAAYDVGKVSRLLAAAIRTVPHDLVLTGSRSSLPRLSVSHPGRPFRSRTRSPSESSRRPRRRAMRR